MTQLVQKNDTMPVIIPGATKGCVPSMPCTHLPRHTHLALMSSCGRLPADHRHQLVQTEYEKENKHD